MKIAMFAPLLGVEATGQSLVVANTANELAAAGHTVTVLATDCGYRGSEVSQFVAFSPQVAVHIFPVTGALNRRLYHSTALIAWVYEHIAEFDVLDIHGIWSWSVGALADAFHIHRKPYVLTPHGAMTRYDWRKGRWKRALFYRLKLSDVWNLADAVRFLSKGEEEQSYYPAHGRSAVVPNGVDVEPAPTAAQRTAARQQLGIASDSQVLLFLGRITHQKGVKEIVAAFRWQRSNCPTCGSISSVLRRVATVRRSSLRSNSRPSATASSHPEPSSATRVTTTFVRLTPSSRSRTTKASHSHTLRRSRTACRWC